VDNAGMLAREPMGGDGMSETTPERNPMTEPLNTVEPTLFHIMTVPGKEPEAYLNGRKRRDISRLTFTRTPEGARVEWSVDPLLEHGTPGMRVAAEMRDHAKNGEEPPSTETLARWAAMLDGTSP
jgi:hypothetical protein